ncbi:Lar family restriction alleviation protein [Cedecea sp.]|jgi:hypothetical protein|uniref:Lar family restriction alleviation protein n=1 Tax=Cedecea sp. TaxID=1970739 RepID=UPI002F3E4D33
MMGNVSIVNSEFPLKPCPSCGTQAVQLVRVTDFGGEKESYYVACTGCNANQFPDVKERAIQDWKQRRDPKVPGYLTERKGSLL